MDLYAAYAYQQLISIWQTDLDNDKKIIEAKGKTGSDLLSSRRFHLSGHKFEVARPDTDNLIILLRWMRNVLEFLRSIDKTVSVSMTKVFAVEWGRWSPTKSI